jgi:hypothetical protein
VEVTKLTTDDDRALKATALYQPVSYFNIANQTCDSYIYMFKGTNRAATLCMSGNKLLTLFDQNKLLCFVQKLAHMLQRSRFIILKLSNL